MMFTSANPTASSSTLLAIVLSIVVVATITTTTNVHALHAGSVALKGTELVYVDGEYNENAVAFGTFDDTLNTTGWGVLRINTNGTYEDLVQMHAAGMLEGQLTAQRMKEMSHISNADAFGDGVKAPQNVVDWFNANQAWVLENIKKHSDSSFWQYMGYLQAQFDGLVKGYAASSVGIASPLSFIDFAVMQAAGDIPDIQASLDPSLRPDVDNWPYEKLKSYIAHTSHCSSVVKVNANITNIFSAHATWSEYTDMNRIYKHYYLDLQAPFIASRGMSFSSYPGYLESIDDFYMMDSGLVMLETTNSVFDKALYDLIKPESLMAWQRVRIANALAHTGEEWYLAVKQYNSGTYNNQYMLVNYNLFTPAQPLVPGTLYVCEQIPGLVVGGDVTVELARGYWPSYNIPYFPEIFNRSGYPSVVKKYGPNYSYQLYSRARIFRRDNHLIEDQTSFHELMRYNAYKTDPFSSGDSMETICSRGDLGTEGTFGCIDGKTTDANMYKTGQAYAISGPTVNGGTLPPFSWKPYPTKVHDGQPDLFNFGWNLMDAKWKAKSLTEKQ